MHVRLRDGRRLGFADWGRRDGRAVLYLHGALGSPLRRCSETDRVLAELGIRYVLVHRPGFGESDPLPGRSLLDHAGDVEQLADRLGLGELRLLGVSAGGPYAAAVAHALGDRVPAVAVVSGLGEVGARGAMAGSSLAQRIGLQAVRRHPGRVRSSADALVGLVRRRPDLLVALLARRAGADGRALADPEAGAIFAEAFLQATRRGVGAMLDDLLLATGPWGFAPQDVAAHVHLWHGTADPAVPLEQALQLAIAFPRCTPALASGEGHFFFRRRMHEVLGALVGPAQPAVDERIARDTRPGSSHIGT